METRRRKLLLLLLLLLRKKKLLLQQRKRITRQHWVHPLNQRRESHGVYTQLVREIRLFGDHHRRYLRMSVENFDHILALVSPFITGQDTQLRKAISPGLKLAVTLHHLAEGATHSCIALHYRLGRSTVSNIIYETCDGIWKALQPVYMKAPDGPSDWKRIAKGFGDTWNFPHCIGSIDGKHVAIQKPKNAGSEFHNYKQTESIVLMAISDSLYRFISVDIGQSGSQSDGGIWESSTMGQALLHGRVNLPEPEVLPLDTSGQKVPFFFVADEAFPLKPYLMRPFPGRQLDSEDKKVYNYRLSRARRVVENAFGILSHRWRLLFRAIVAEPDKATKLVKAMCVLHNFLRTVQDEQYAPPGLADSVDQDGHVKEGFWRGSQVGVLGQEGHSSRSATQEGSKWRQYLVNYFYTQGSVPWQLGHVNART